MLAGAVRRSLAPEVARGDGDVQPAAGFQPVLGLDVQAERVSLPAVRGRPEHDRGCVVADWSPRRPAGQAVDRVPAGWLGQGQIVLGPAEGVMPAVDPVRPGREQLTCAGRGHLVGFVAEDHRPVMPQQFAQPGTELGHCGPVRPG
jgi:hypothetical protein